MFDDTPALHLLFSILLHEANKESKTCLAFETAFLPDIILDYLSLQIRRR